MSGVDSHQVEFFMRVDLFLGYQRVADNRGPILAILSPSVFLFFFLNKNFAVCGQVVSVGINVYSLRNAF